ncbi:Uma2 family endonuclease [Oculatella sp. FACHB-28]|uniref:Uma2 family endonuclease n=1 Tax=Cyanophyceae TaxID=3028117 RepID=UPI0016898F5C|nr:MULTISPECIES: Uma2 family endonuclease [Cyanophyceae]MBD1866717.1 Uma2 family endonuclease [Cyanobacteria bacterium FACHB-471]MBD2000799.1 Uma2 family endonuclease [Leptolyngbya sp. FACHB-541]MBD2056891.1 Uma2 family endonuclease [Oculatella sp. FACHB-28]
MTPALEKPRSSEDKVAVYYDRTWEQFKWIQKGLEGHPGVRLSFYEGVVEVFMPGQPHEIFKKVIAALLEAFFFEWNIRIIPTGSVTQEQKGVASVQADESYCFAEAKPIPDLSIEVVFTSGSATKLERYRALSVPEVWLWEDGLLTLHRLGENGYTQIDRSQIPELANLDIELFSRCVLIGETDWLEAMRTFKNAISKG